MKRSLLAIGFAIGLTLSLSAKETLHLKLQPEQDVVLAGSPQEVVVKIDLTASTPEKFRRTPLNLAVVLDRSGSMSGAKIEQARQAAIGLVDQLVTGDIFSLVAYSSEVQVLVPAQAVEDKQALKRIIARISADGNTALYGGVEKGAEELARCFSKQKINRVILLSDGLANVGLSSTPDLRRLGNRLAERGISVTTIGLGDDYNEDLMSGLAEASDANYYYVKDTEKLPQIFAKELGQLLEIAAHEIKIEVTCPDGIRPIGFIGRPEQFQGQKAVVYFNNFVAGQNRYLFLRCRAHEKEKAAAREIATVTVHYSDQSDGKQYVASETLKLQFSTDSKQAIASVDRAISAHRELMITATIKDTALLQADKGDYAKACETLASQADRLASCVSQAPAELRPQLEQEAQTLRSRAGELKRGNYSSTLRKQQQAESWNYRNSK
jgi:Ca-activated chloride channel family protein